MTLIPFIKMHGCGNDYVFLDCFAQAAPVDPAALALVVCDRHRAIGADGLVLMLPPDVRGATARMRMFNADGSEGAFCGNAIRCMAMWLSSSGHCEVHSRIAMAERLVDAELVSRSQDNRSAIVRIVPGEPDRLSPSETDRRAFVRQLPLADLVRSDLPLPQLIAPVFQVSLSNPHTVLFVAELSDCDVSGVGPGIEHHPIFPDRTNVEFVKLTGPSTATVRVWERGSGETRACGSGACAVAIAGLAAHLFEANHPVTLRMPGGDLQVHWDSANRIHLEGPAEEVFRGTWEHHSF